MHRKGDREENNGVYVRGTSNTCTVHTAHTVMYLIYFVLVDNDFTMYCHSTINSVSFSHLFEH